MSDTVYPSQPWDIQATAWHEAGHAVAYVLHRAAFRYVTLRPRSADVVGQVTLYGPVMRNSVTLACLAASGPLSEARYYEAQGHDPEEALWLTEFFGGAAHDAELIRRCAIGEVDEVYGIARLVMADHWLKVDRIAHELLARRKALTHAEVKALMGQ